MITVFWEVIYEKKREKAMEVYGSQFESESRVKVGDKSMNINISSDFPSIIQSQIGSINLGMTREEGLLVVW